MKLTLIREYHKRFPPKSPEVVVETSRPSSVCGYGAMRQVSQTQLSEYCRVAQPGGTPRHNACSAVWCKCECHEWHEWGDYMMHSGMGD